jgi:oxygen-independent coproporphyrinogen-3 oxidase
MEANPDDITPEKAKAWKAMGINRFSIGIQSFFEEDLKWMNRAHDAQQSRRCIEIIKAEGFNNFSIDLIYGTPGQTHERWIENLEIAILEKIPHLSCYALTVEEGTALQSMIKSGKKEKVDSNEQSICFDTLVQKTREAGYRHYEISNFALSGMESKHNQSYWKGIPYWGFGPAAHSFDGKSRRWNVANNVEYMTSIENNKIPSENELLSEADQLNEYIMTSLRCDTGINKNFFKENWGEEKLIQLRKEIKVAVELGRVIEDEICFKLTDQGRFFADGIASSLFFLSN